MKICYIADGKSHHNRTLLNYLAKKGYDIHLISSRFIEGYDREIHLYKLHRIFPQNFFLLKLINGFFWLLETRKLVKEIKPDLLDVHFITILGYLGFVTGFHPLIINVWGNDIFIDPEISIFHEWMAKAVLKKADMVTCKTREQFDALLKYVPESKIVILPWTVDCQVFKPVNKKVNISHKTIGVVKALEPTYGIEYLIQAVPFIAREFDKLRVIIVGPGDQEPYQKLARDLKVVNLIEFTGTVPNERVPDYISQMDVFIMPTIHETFGVSALEAQAMEVPVVASKVGGIPAAVSEGITGFLVEPRNPRAIADAVIRLLQDDSLREKMGKKGREFVISNFDRSINLQKRENLYREMVKKFHN